MDIFFSELFAAFENHRYNKARDLSKTIYWQWWRKPKKKIRLNTIASVSAVNIGALAAGCALTWSSPTLSKLMNGDTNSGLRITEDEASWVGSLVTLGAAIGPILAGALLDRFGRKNTILLSMILSAVSWLIIGLIPNLYALYSARVLAGIAVGIIYTAVPMYIAEIAEVTTIVWRNELPL